MFGLEPNYGCCTANFNQGWPKLALSAFMYNDESVASVLPIPSQLKTEELSITLETEYPFENTLKYTVIAKKDFTFEIRLPKDAENIVVNGQSEHQNHLAFNVTEGEKREVVITFDFTPHFEKYAYDLNYVKYGNLVFSLPIEVEKMMHEYEKDSVKRKYPYCDYELVPKSDWNYGFADTTLKTERKTVSDVPFSYSNPPITITAKMQKIDWGLEDGYESVCAKTPQSLIPVSDMEELSLIPYGCAKLRMTLLPFVEHSPFQTMQKSTN